MDTDTQPTDAPDIEATDTSEELGDPGKAALQTERKARRDAEKALKTLQSQLDELRTAAMTEQEKAIDEARRAARTEALAEVNARVLRAEVRSVASGRLLDPDDALRFIDLSTISVDADGNVDSKELNAALDALVKQKPYLAAQRVGGDADAGARGAAPSTTGSMNDRIRRAAGVA